MKEKYLYSKKNYFDYVNENPNLKIVVYGAGNIARNNIKDIGKVDFFCDRNADKLGDIDGVSCILPKALKEFEEKIIILICVEKKAYVEEICSTVDQLAIEAEVFWIFDNEAFSFFDTSKYKDIVRFKDKLQIHIIYKEDGWIFGKFARKLKEELELLDQEVSISDREDPEADVNHYVSYGYLTKFFDKDNTVRTTMITHIDNLQKKDLVLYQALHNVVGICMSFDTLNKLSMWGIPREKICYVNPAHDGEIKPRKIVLGITNRCYQTKDFRKRDDIVVKVCEHLDPNCFMFKIMGSGWEMIVEQLNEMGFEVEYYNDFDKEKYHTLMPSLDYWIYYGFDEGAMGYLDALAAGVKTIATPQGYHLDVNGLTYPCSTISDFVKTLQKIQEEKMAIIELVSDWTWDNFARKHLEIWQYLTNSKPLEEVYARQSEYKDGIFSLLLTNNNRKR